MRKPIAAFIIGAFTLTLAAAGAMPIAGASQPLRLTVATLQRPGSLDRRTGNSAIAREVWNLQYLTLTALDPKTLGTAPGLAVAWSPAPHANGWIYQLRRKITWSDGQPVTAADVVYSLDHARDDHWPYTAGMFDGLTARPLGPHSVEVTSTGTGRRPPGLLLPVVPEHVYSKADNVDADLSKLGVADGTWHVVSKSPDSVQLDAVGSTAGPDLKQIVFRSYPNDDSLIEALAHGQVDVVSGLPDADAGRLQALSNVTVDHAGDGTKYILRVESLPGADTRRAISLAIDRSELVADAVYGVGTPAAVDAQPELAKTELRVLASSTSDTPITIAIPPDATSRRVGDVVRKDLAAAGVHSRTGIARANLAIERVPAGVTSANAVELFEPDTLQAFRSDNVTGWLPEPEQRRLVVFGPTVAQYGQLTAAGAPPGEGSSNSVYALGAVIVLALCGAVYWIASRFHRRFASSEESHAGS